MTDHFKNSSEDPRLSAYLFDELGIEERAQFEKELKANESLQEALSQLRQISSLMGRAFAEERLPGETQLSSEKETPAPASNPRKLSARARAGRVARFRQDIPKINTSAKNRYTAMVGAIAAAVVLAGLVTLQSVIDSSQSNDEDVAYIPLTTTRQGEYDVSIPLSTQIAENLAAESAAYEAELDAVTNEVALGLADAFESSPLELDSDRDRTSSELGQSPRLEIEVAKPEISLRSAFANPPVRVLEVATRPRESFDEPRVFLENDRSARVGSLFQSTKDFRSSRIPLHVEANDLGELKDQIEEKQEVPSLDITIAGLLNAFDYARSKGSENKAESTFELDLEVAETPWNRVHYLVRLTVDSGRYEADGGVRAGPLANDVRLEVKFNPEQIAAYRLIGYEPEVVTSDEIFAEPGESVAHGYQLTVLYEVVPVGSPVPQAAGDAEERFEVALLPGKAGQRGTELLWANIDYSLPNETERFSLEKALSMPAAVPSWHGASRAFQWAAAVASFGMEILDDPLLTGANWEMIEALARSGASEEEGGYYLQFISMIESVKAME